MNDQQPQSIPVWAYEKVTLENPDSKWKARGVQYRTELMELLSEYNVEALEHVGSTSIPNMPAKPIIDLIALLPSFEKLDEIEHLLSGHGWNYVPPELDNQPWRRFFVHVTDDKRRAHLQLLAEREPHWNEQIAFRDLLTANPSLAEQYTVLKEHLVFMYPDDRERYTQAKSAFVHTVLNQKKDDLSAT